MASSPTTRCVRKEFARILKPGGWVVLIWNDHRLELDTTPFLRGYEELLQRYGTDYEQVRQQNVSSEIAGFFAPGSFKLKVLENSQSLDLELKGRVFSASYTPEPGHPNFEPMLRELEAIFDAHQETGRIAIEYDTKVSYGHI